MNVIGEVFTKVIQLRLQRVAGVGLHCPGYSGLRCLGHRNT